MKTETKRQAPPEACPIAARAKQGVREGLIKPDLRSCFPLRTFARELPPFQFIAKSLVRYVQPSWTEPIRKSMPPNMEQHRKDVTSWSSATRASAVWNRLVPR